MSPNPEAMSSISAANALSYHVEGRTYNKAVESPCLEEIKGCDSPKESYVLTQDSITKLKSFFGQKMSNDPVKRTVFSSYEDVKKLNELAKILERVEECPWYWGNLTGQDSKKVLTGAEPGTFLLRLSSDPKYLFSLSVKTKRGPTSIRIVHENGYFRFDSELNEAQRLARNAASSGDSSTNRKGHPNYVHRITKKFTCVIHLVLYYTKHLLQNCPEENNDANEMTVPNDEAIGLNREDKPGELFMCYWVTRNGRKEIPVLLSTPLPRKQFFPSLQSLCRNALSKEYELWDPANQDFVDRKELPTSLRRFIKQYPYPI